MAVGTAQESRLAIVIDTRDSEARIKRLREQLRELGGSANAAGAGANAAGASAQRLGRNASSTTTAIQRMTQSMGALSGAFAAFASVAGVLSVLKTADAMQSLNSKIKLATESSEEYLAVQGRLRAMAQSNLTQYDSLVDLYASSRRALKQLGKTQNETLAFTDNLTKAMFVGGGAASSQAAALVQLGQALASGVLRGDEFNSIAEQAPILLELVAKKMGVAQGALRKLAADGKISSSILYDSISDATEKLTEMAGKMPATMAQGFETVKNQWKFFIDDMLNSTGGFSNIVASALIGLGQSLNSLIPIIVAGGLAWGAYALATSAAVATGLASAISGMAGMGGWLLFNSLLIKAQILSFSGLSAIMSVYSAKLAVAAAAVKAKAVAMGQLLAITALTTAAIVRNGDVTFTLMAAMRGAATAIAQKVAAMRAGISVSALYTATLSGVAGAAGIAAASVKGLGLAMARLGGIINAHPIMFLAATLLSVVAATEDAEGKTRGFAGAMDSLGEAVQVVGSLFLDFVKFTIDGISSVGQVFGQFITSFVQNSESGANESSNMFAVFFSNTEGGFVGLLQVWARFSDLAAASTRNLIKSVVRGMSNLTKDVANKAGVMANVLVDAFEWAAGGIAKTLNFISGGVGWAVKQLNKISPIQIGVEEREYAAPKLTRFLTDRKLEIQDWSESMMPIMADQIENGLSGTVQRAIDSTRLAAQQAKADLDLVSDAMANFDDADDKKKKKAKAKKEKKPKTPKTPKDKEAEAYARLIESYEQQLASFDREIYDTMASFNTELRKIGYEVDDVAGKFYALPEAFKDNLRKAASALDEQKILSTYRDTINSLGRELSLLDNDSLFSQWAYDLNDASNILSTMDEDLKGSILESVAKLEKAKAESTINKSIEESIEGINKEIALMATGGSALDEFIYDLNNTEKFANASGDAINALGDALTNLDNLKKGEALNNVMGEILQESPMAKIEADYQRRLEVINDYESQWTDLVGVHSAERAAIEEAYMTAKQQLMLGQSEAIFDGLAGMAKGFLGEQSGVYRALYVMQKAYALSSALLSSKKAVMDAWSNTAGGYFAKAAAAGQVLLSTSAITSAIAGLSPKGFKQGGYTGNMGASQVAGVVHGQEYVFDAQATKRIGVDNLNAMRSGKGKGETKVIVNNYSNEKANVQTTPDGDAIVTIGKMVGQMVDGKLSAWERKAKRQGGALYGT